MEYLIDDIVIYRTDDGVLWSVGNEDEKVTLSPTSNRLLSAILEGRENPIHRDELLKKVWDEYGLVSSGNSLNYYLSQLRKTLLSLGLSANIIETIPKIGLQFSNEVTVTVMVPHLKKLVKNRTQSKLSRRKLSFSLLFIISTFLIICFLYTKSSGVNVNPPMNIGDIDACPVRYLSAESRMSNKKDTNHIVQFMSQHSVRCNKNQVIYFNGDHNFWADGKGKVFLSVCISNEGVISSCDNYLTQDWRAPQ